MVEVDDARTQLTWLMNPKSGRHDIESETRQAYVDAADELLNEAQAIADGRAHPRGAITGAHIQAAHQYLQAADINLLRLSPADYLQARLPDIRSEALKYFDKSDHRVVRLQELIDEPPMAVHRSLCTAGEGPGESPEQPSDPPDAGEDPPKDDGEFSPFDRSLIIQTQKSVNTNRQTEQSRVRSFRNVIVGVALAITVMVIGLAIMGWISPQTLPMCFVPDNQIVVCPTDEAELTSDDDTQVEISEAEREAAGRWDISVVALIGVLGATLAAAAGLRTIRGSSDPFSLPVALAFLKLPSGAFTAVLGLLLIRAGFVPGLSALDTSAQIVAYSILLGYSQQLFTTFVDRQARSVLVEAGTTTPQPASIPSQ